MTDIFANHSASENVAYLPRLILSFIIVPFLIVVGSVLYTLDHILPMPNTPKMKYIQDVLIPGKDLFMYILLNKWHQ